VLDESAGAGKRESELAGCAQAEVTTARWASVSATLTGSSAQRISTPTVYCSEREESDSAR
jgi:hypothetical protein